MTLANLIRNYRKEHDISQRQMAAMCNVSAGYISLIEKEINPQTGKQMTPSVINLNKLAIGMGMTIDELFNKCDDMKVSIKNIDQSSSIDLQITKVIMKMSDETKKEALKYLRYIASEEDNQ